MDGIPCCVWQEISDFVQPYSSLDIYSFPILVFSLSGTAAGLLSCFVVIPFVVYLMFCPSIRLPSAPSSSSSFYLELGASAAISRASAGRPTSQMRGCWLFKSSPDIPTSHTSCSNAVSTFWCCPRPALLLKKVVLLWSKKAPKIGVKKNNENKPTLNREIISRPPASYMRVLLV